MSQGEILITDGTCNHLLMWDLRQHGISGSKVQLALDKMNITTNKNSIVGDKSAVTPGGIRLGTPALTTRGMNEKDMRRIANYLVKAIKISKIIAKHAESKKLKDFEKVLNGKIEKEYGDKLNPDDLLLEQIYVEME